MRRVLPKLLPTLLPTLLTALLASLVLMAAPARAADTEADRWNLADLYASTEAWQADATRLGEQLKDFARCRGRLGESATRLRNCLDLRADMLKRLYRLWVYSGEQLAADTGVASSQALDQKAELLSSQLDEATAFVEPEILRLGARRIEAFLARDPGLRVHRHPLRRTLRAAPHTLDAAGEALVAQFGPMKDTGRAAYDILTDADIAWPRLRLNSGEEVTLDATAFTRYRESADRDERKRVLDAFLGTLARYERTLGTLLYAQLKQDAVMARVRRHPDSISHALAAENVPVAVIDTLIRETHAGLPTLHRYFRLRQRMLGLPDLAYHDLYPPLLQIDLRFDLAQARRQVLASVAPLGADYVRDMARGFDSRWMDAYPRPRKRSGAHMAGGAYDVHPYVLLNYNDDYASFTTLAHEWGHAMHSVLANRAQPFVTADYATFVAEIASTFNEALLLEHMLAGARNDDERLLYLGHALEDLRGTYFLQAMFAEFERRIHATVDAGEPLTGEQLSKTYCELLRRYSGTAEGVMAVDDKVCVFWAYIPHFYNAFYVYQYATSIAASSLFAQRVLAGEPGALDRYLGLLRAGGSGDAYALVKAAGVDLATPTPYRALVARMNRIMDEMEAILVRRR